MDPSLVVISGLFLVIAALVPLVMHSSRQIGEINHAVNHKDSPEERTLREYARDAAITTELLKELVNAQRIALETHKEALEMHTRQDSISFHELRDLTNAVRKDIRRHLAWSEEKSEELRRVAHKVDELDKPHPDH